MVEINKLCPKCDTPTILEQEFCSKCGNSVDSEKATQHCGACGNIVNYPNEFCNNCGKEMPIKELVKISYCDKCKTEYDKSIKFCEIDGNALVYKDREIDGNTNIKTDSSISNNIELKEQVDESLGFGWGNFLIFMGFFQGSIAFIFGFLGGIETEYIPNKGVALLISVIALGSAFGLYQRRLYGLYVLYFSLIINIVFGLIAVYEGDEFYQFGGIFAIIISVLWGMYFKKREAMFT